MLIRPTLLLEPSGEPLHLFLRNHSTRAHVGKALRDLLLHVDVVLDVLERRVIRKLLKELLHFLFRCLHRNLQRIKSTVAEKGASEKDCCRRVGGPSGSVLAIAPDFPKVASAVNDCG